MYEQIWDHSPMAMPASTLQQVSHAWLESVRVYPQNECTLQSGVSLHRPAKLKLFLDTQKHTCPQDLMYDDCLHTIIIV